MECSVPLSSDAELRSSEEQGPYMLLTLLGRVYWLYAVRRSLPGLVGQRLNIREFNMSCSA